MNSSSFDWANVCPFVRCKGERIIREQASLEVQIPKGAPDQLRIEYPGVGSQSLGRAAGNVEVMVALRNLNAHFLLTNRGGRIKVLEKGNVFFFLRELYEQYPSEKPICRTEYKLRFCTAFIHT